MLVTLSVSLPIRQYVHHLSNLFLGPTSYRSDGMEGVLVVLRSKWASGLTDVSTSMEGSSPTNLNGPNG